MALKISGGAARPLVFSDAAPPPSSRAWRGAGGVGAQRPSAATTLDFVHFVEEAPMMDIPAGRGASPRQKSSRDRP